MAMVRRLRRRYHTANIPSEAETNAEQRFYLAILSADQTFDDFVVPATWRLIWDDGEYVRIVRQSHTWEEVNDDEPTANQ